MKDLPIIFSSHSVQAILSGIKTQTRRVVELPQTVDDVELRDYRRDEIHGPEWYTPAVEGKGGEMEPGREVFGIYDSYGEWGIKCPYVPGRKLWVRETWAVDQQRNRQKPFELPDDLETWYKAGGSRYGVPDSDWQRGKWRPAIFMPRWASRITLEVAAVRVERLQDITVDDAITEGMEEMPGVWDWLPEPGDGIGLGPRKFVTAFSHAWDAMHAKRGYSWESNPYVWVVTFERVETD